MTGPVLVPGLPATGRRVLRVLVADDNPVVLRGVVTVLDTDPTVQVVGEATDGRRAVELARSLRPDVALFDVRMPGLDGVEATRLVAATVPVLLLTYDDRPGTIAAALAAGARGYLVHGRFGLPELLRAVHGVPAGEAHLSPCAAGEAIRQARDQLRPLTVGTAAGLTPREAEIADLVLAGRSNAEIAGALFLSEKTVKNALTRVFAKLGARTRAEAVAVLTGRAPAPPSPGAHR